MDIQEKCIFVLLILEQFASVYFPTDIIHLIISIYKDILPTDLLCCSDSITILKFDNKIYSYGGFCDELDNIKSLQNFIDSGNNILQISIRDEDHAIFFIDNFYRLRTTQDTTSNIIMDKIKYISFRKNNFTVVKTNGDLHMGSNKAYEKLGPAKLSDVAQISCNKYNNSALITKNSDLYAWGYNEYGQLGLGHCQDLAIFSNPQKISSGYICVSCGYRFTMAIDKFNQLYACGDGSNGQLGLGDYKDRSSLTKVLVDPVVSVSCGMYFTMALATNGELFSWGNNFTGQLDTTTNNGDNRYLPKKIAWDIKMVSCGDMYTIAINIDNDIIAWGSQFNDDYGRSLITIEDRFRLFDNQSAL